MLAKQLWRFSILSTSISTSTQIIK